MVQISFSKFPLLQPEFVVVQKNNFKFFSYKTIQESHILITCKQTGVI